MAGPHTKLKELLQEESGLKPEWLQEEPGLRPEALVLHDFIYWKIKEDLPLSVGDKLNNNWFCKHTNIFRCGIH